MLDVIHLIVTVLSDRSSFDWECNVTARPIWLTFLTCFHVVAAQQWHGRDAVWGFGKGRWVCSGWWQHHPVVLTTHFYGSHKGSWKSQLLYAGCVHFTVDWLFRNLYGSYIAPRPLLSWEKPQETSVLIIWEPLRQKVSREQHYSFLHLVSQRI